MDSHRRDSGLTAGDRVLLSTKHLQLKGVSGKMKPRFVGPFTIEEMVGTNAVRLSLPAAMRVHPVFNVSLVKLYRGDAQRPPPIEVDGQEEFEVGCIK